jgi:ATP-dependent RNA helicase DeaD
LSEPHSPPPGPFLWSETPTDNVSHEPSDASGDESDRAGPAGPAPDEGGGPFPPRPPLGGDLPAAARPPEPIFTEGKPLTEFPLEPDVLERLRSMGIRNATPIQERVIGPIIAGRDVIGKAETGTGKTIGFGAPMVGKIDTQRVAVQALVLTPTRELAQQVAGVLEQIGQSRNMGVALLVGGVHASGQILKLRSGSQVVVGTPGRILDLLGDRTLSLVWCELVVLDEADRMLDMGFIDEVSAILDRIPPERQTLLFSATIPPGVEKLARRYMRDPEVHSTSQGLSTVSEITQLYQEVDFRDKFRSLRKILDDNPDDTCIIFTNTRRQAIDLDRMLWGHGYAAGALHGEQEQDVRFKILEAFRRREIKVLVATDVASRGLDIDDITRIINYEVPDEPESYVHRIGRTGRAAKSGIAITLVAGKEIRNWERILQTTRFTMERIGAPLSATARAEGAREARLERSRWGRKGGGGRRGGSGGGGGGSRGAGGRHGQSSRSGRSGGSSERHGHPARSGGQDSSHRGGEGAPRHGSAHHGSGQQGGAHSGGGHGHGGGRPSHPGGAHRGESHGGSQGGGSHGGGSQGSKEGGRRRGRRGGSRGRSSGGAGGGGSAKP